MPVILLYGAAAAAIVSTAVAMAMVTYAIADWLAEGRARFTRQREGAEEPKRYLTREPEEGITGAAKQLSRRFAPLALRQLAARQLALAGNPRDMTVEDVFFLKGSLALIAAVLVGAMAFAGKAGGRGLVLMSIVVVPTAFFLPDLWLSRRGEERQNKIRRELPGALDILTISVEAGLSFDGAVAKVVENASGPLAEEFLRTSREMQLGVNRREAFHNLATRTNVDELNSFILAVTQADAFGVSIGNVLRAQSREMRVKQRQAAEERAMKTPVKIIFPLLLCIFPAILIVVLGPAVIRMIQAFGQIGG